MAEFHLEKANTDNTKILVWHAVLKSTNDSGHTLFEWTYGQQGGKMQIRSRMYTKGLVNRSPWDQAMLECRKMVNDKIDKGYYAINASNATNATTESVPDGHEKDHVPMPMLAHNATDYPDLLDGPGIIMVKLDGIFCMGNLRTGETWSRGRKRFTCLQHIESAIVGLQYEPNPLLTFDTKDPWIVGELHADDLTFQQISGLVRRSNAKNDDILKIKFKVFDGIWTNDIVFRLKTLSDIFHNQPDASALELVAHHSVENVSNNIEYFHEYYTSRNYEGIMIHRFGAHGKTSKTLKTVMPGYAQGIRTNWLLKYKKFMQEEYQCIQINPRKHDHAIAGSVLLQNSKGQVFSATPDCSNAEKAELWEHREEYVGATATVKFFCYTDKGIPRFPVLLGFRDRDDMQES